MDFPCNEEIRPPPTIDATNISTCDLPKQIPGGIGCGVRPNKKVMAQARLARQIVKQNDLSAKSQVLIFKSPDCGLPHKFSLQLHQGALFFRR